MRRFLMACLLVLGLGVGTLSPVWAADDPVICVADESQAAAAALRLPDYRHCKII